MDQGKATGSPTAEIVTPASHSPLPWEHVAATDNHGAYIVNCYGGDVCDLYAMSNPGAFSICNGGNSRPVPFTDMDGNAAFIVRAVNSHAALIASLQEMMGVYWGDGDGELPEPGCIIRARKALSDAGVTVQSSVNGSGEVNQ